MTTACRSGSRSGRHRVAELLTAIAIGGTCVFVSQSTALAHGILDQANTAAPSAVFVCGVGTAIPGTVALGQSFTPAQSSLVAVEPILEAYVMPEDGVLLRVDIRDGGPDGVVLATTTARIPRGVQNGTRLQPHFDFVPPLRGVAGKLLFMELIVPNHPTRWQSSIGWPITYSDSYPGGRAQPCFYRGYPLITGGAVDDFLFITYAEGLGGDHVCPQSRGHVPEPVVQAALADPSRVAGYNQLERPGLPPGPYNRLRTWLTLQRLAVPYHPMGNPLVFRGGCP